MSLSSCNFAELQICIITFHFNNSCFFRDNTVFCGPTQPRKKPLQKESPRSFSSPLCPQLDPAAGEKGDSVVAGGVKSAARVAPWPDGWFAKQELGITGTLVTQLLIPRTIVTPWVVLLLHHQGFLTVVRKKHLFEQHL